MEINYKAICLDLDGTLLNRNNEVSEINRQALRKKIQEGKKVFLVTGRPFCFAIYQAKQIHEDIQVIAFNGACYEKKDILVEYFLQEHVVHNIIDLVEKYEVHAFFKAKNHVYTHEAYDERFVYDQYASYKGFPFCESHNNLSYPELHKKAKKILKVLIYDFDSEKLSLFRKSLSELPQLSITRSNSISLDIMDAHADKGNAIQDVMNQQNIRREEIVAFGDNENDIAMFKVCGICIAMGNSNQELKQYCCDTTKTNEEDGVGWYLENKLG